MRFKSSEWSPATSYRVSAYSLLIWSLLKSLSSLCFVNYSNALATSVAWLRGYSSWTTSTKIFAFWIGKDIIIRWLILVTPGLIARMSILFVFPICLVTKAARQERLMLKIKTQNDGHALPPIFQVNPRSCAEPVRLCCHRSTQLSGCQIYSRIVCGLSLHVSLPACSWWSAEEAKLRARRECGSWVCHRFIGS